MSGFISTGDARRDSVEGNKWTQFIFIMITVLISHKEIVVLVFICPKATLGPSIHHAIHKHWPRFDLTPHTTHSSLPEIYSTKIVKSELVSKKSQTRQASFSASGCLLLSFCFFTLYFFYCYFCVFVDPHPPLLLKLFSESFSGGQATFSPVRTGASNLVCF